MNGKKVQWCCEQYTSIIRGVCTIPTSCPLYFTIQVYYATRKFSFRSQNLVFNGAKISMHLYSDKLYLLSTGQTYEVYLYTIQILSRITDHATHVKRYNDVETTVEKTDVEFQGRKGPLISHWGRKTCPCCTAVCR
jgi:hypothetical protein